MSPVSIVFTFGDSAFFNCSLGSGMETAQSASSVNQLDDAAQGARWEDRLSDLARVESILKKRKAELQEMDTVLMERSRRLDDVAHKV